MDLTGPEGNVFMLIGTAMNLARQFDYDDEMIKEEMMFTSYGLINSISGPLSWVAWNGARHAVDRAIRRSIL